MFIQSYDDSNLVSNLFTQTSDKVISNTAAETTLIGSGVGSLTFPVNFFHEGRSIQGNVLGKISAVNGASSTIKISLGETTLVEVTSTFPATFTDVLFNAEFTFTYHVIYPFFIQKIRIKSVSKMHNYFAFINSLISE